MPDTDLRTLQKVSSVSILQAEYLFSGGYYVIFFFNLFKKGDVLRESSSFTLHFVVVLTALGLHCYMWAFSTSCGEWRLLASCSAWTPLRGGFSCCREWALGVQTHCGMLPCCIGDLPDPGIELVSSALAGGFLTTGPPGKPALCTADFKY